VLITLNIEPHSIPHTHESLPKRRAAGFSMIELLVILSIVAILTIGGAVMMGSRQAGAVRSLLDELEGAISNARQAAVATGRDTALVCWGAWDKDNPLRIAFGDANILQSADGPSNFVAIVDQILGKPDNKPQPIPPNPPAIGNLVNVSTGELDQLTVGVGFQYLPRDPVQRKAAIVTDGPDRGNWEIAKGGSDDIESVPPFNGEFNDVLDVKNNFCTGQSGESGSLSQLTINGYTKRFSATVFIKVVTVNSTGSPVAGGPMGLIALKENGASVFKFYNPGKKSGDGKWRRI